MNSTEETQISTHYDMSSMSPRKTLKSASSGWRRGSLTQSAASALWKSGGRTPSTPSAHRESSYGRSTTTSRRRSWKGQESTKEDGSAQSSSHTSGDTACSARYTSMAWEKHKESTHPYSISSHLVLMMI